VVVAIGWAAAAGQPLWASYSRKTTVLRVRRRASEHGDRGKIPASHGMRQSVRTAEAFIRGTRSAAFLADRSEKSPLKCRGN